MVKPSALVDRQCLACGKTFQEYRSRIERGYGKYCSRACSDPARAGANRPFVRHLPSETRICIVCGKPFTVGGRGNPQRDQERCSRACMDASRYRRGAPVLPLSPTDAAYLAGFIDGEGSIVLYLASDVVRIRLSAYNTVKSVLEWIATTTGVGQVLLSREAGGSHQTSWHWQVSAEAVSGILDQIRPYMKVKIEQADLALETQARLRVPALKADRTWQADYRARMQHLNRRGPRTSEDDP